MGEGGGGTLYRMKFDLVWWKLWKILLVQEIREPNHVDHVIGHLIYTDCLLIHQAFS